MATADRAFPGVFTTPEHLLDLGRFLHGYTYHKVICPCPLYPYHHFYLIVFLLLSSSSVLMALTCLVILVP